MLLEAVVAAAAVGHVEPCRSGLPSGRRRICAAFAAGFGRSACCGLNAVSEPAATR